MFTATKGSDNGHGWTNRLWRLSIAKTCFHDSELYNIAGCHFAELQKLHVGTSSENHSGPNFD